MKTNRRNRILKTAALFILVAIVIASAAVVTIARNEAIRLVTETRRPVTQTPDEYGFVDWETVQFESSDGLTLAGTFIPPASDSNGATIIYVHGFTGNRGNLLDQAEMLAPYGYGAFLFDLRGHGESEGSLTTFGYEEVQDVQGAIDYLATRPEVNSDLLGIVGVSLGGSVVIRSTARIPEIDMMVVESTFTSIEDNIASGVEILTGLPAFPFANLVVFFASQEAELDIDLVRPIDDIDDITPRPILIMHGTNDRLIPYQNGESLFAAAGDPKSFYRIEGAGHGNIISIDPDTFEQQLTSFVTNNLPAK